MRALGALFVVVGIAPAHAHPVRIGGFARQGYKVSVLHATDDAKLLALLGDRATDEGDPLE